MTRAAATDATTVSATVAITGMSFRRPVFIGDEVTCYAESEDGITFHKPDLGLSSIRTSRRMASIFLDMTSPTGAGSGG